MISCTGQVLYPAAADQDDTMLLKVVAFAGNIARNLDSGGETYPGQISERRVGLFGGQRLRHGAHDALLGGGLVRHLLGKRRGHFLQGRGR